LRFEFSPRIQVVPDSRKRKRNAEEKPKAIIDQNEHSPYNLKVPFMKQNTLKTNGSQQNKSKESSMKKSSRNSKKVIGNI
jgi:hypothetical protein